MNTGLGKNIIIERFHGGGKIFFMMYIVVYARSKYLIVIKVAMMRHQEIHLDGWHWHKILCITVDRGNSMSIY